MTELRLSDFLSPYKVLTTSQPDYLHNLISVQSSGRTRSSSVVTLDRPSVSSSLPTAPLDMHHLTFGINSLLHSVNLILFTLLLAHLILHMSPHHSHHLHSHHLSLPPPFTPDLKPISFTNPFLHSHSYFFRGAFTDLNLYCIKGASTGVVCFSFFFVAIRVLDKAEYSAFQSTLNSPIVSYRIVSLSVSACDRQMNGQTSCYNIVRAMHTCRVVKTKT